MSHSGPHDIIDSDHFRGDPWLFLGDDTGLAGRVHLLRLAERSFCPTFADIGCVLGRPDRPVPTVRAHANTDAIRRYVRRCTDEGRPVRLRGVMEPTSLDYVEPMLFAGARYGLEIDFLGTQPRNVRAPDTPYGHFYANLENLVFPHASETYAERGVYRGSETPRYFGPRLDSAPAGSRSVELLAGEAMPMDVTVGEIVEIYGGARQPNGFPEHTYVHHRARVTGVEAMRVHFDAPLRCAVDVRWIERPAQNGVAVGGGAPRLRSWHRPGAFLGIEEVVLRGYRPLPNPNWDGGKGVGRNRIARASFRGIRRVFVENAFSESGLYPGQADHLLFENSTFLAAVEADKGIGTVHFRNCRLGGWHITGGAETCILETSTIDGDQGFGGWARTVLSGNVLLGRGWGTSRGMFKVPFGCLSLSMRGNRWENADPDVGELVVSDLEAFADCRRRADGLLDLGVDAARYWETPIHRMVFWGKRLVTAEGVPAARIKGLPVQVEGRVAVEADFFLPLAAPTTLHCVTLEHVDDGGDNIYGGAHGAQVRYRARSSFPLPTSFRGRNAAPGTFIFDCSTLASAAGDSAFVGLPDDGLVTDIQVWVVTSAEAGKAPMRLLFKLQPDNGQHMIVDTRQAGLRHASLTGPRTAFVGDGEWDALPTTPSGPILVRTLGGGQGASPYWVCKIAYVPVSAGL